MKRRFVNTVLASLAAAVALAAAPAANAQELQLTGPLKGAPAVRHLKLYRQGRFEIAPAASFSLLDEYRRTILVGARLNYNITDWLAIGVWGGAGVVSLTTDLTDKIDTVSPRDKLTAVNVNHIYTANGNTTNPTFGNASFAAQTAKISYVVSPQLTFTPFRGKLAIFNKIFVDTDLYLAGGLAIVGIQERGACGGSAPLQCTDPASFDLASKTKFTGTFGVGLDFYPSDFVSFGVEYRAVPFSWNRAGFDSRGSGPNGNFPDGKIDGQDDTFKFNQFVTVDIGFSFPTRPKISE
jgi:outer membrane beta-barrel protein